MKALGLWAAIMEKDSNRAKGLIKTAIESINNDSKLDDSSKKSWCKEFEPIQKLIIANKFPADVRVARALLKFTSAVRIKLATHLSENLNIKVKTILMACERLMEDKDPKKKLKRPAIELSGAIHANVRIVSAKNIRSAAKRMCEKCNQIEDRLREGGEPAWSMVVHAVDQNCKSCELKEMQRICTLCPAVAFLRNLLNLKDKNGKSK